jgi:hypothetical protein
MRPTNHNHRLPSHIPSQTPLTWHSGTKVVGTDSKAFQNMISPEPTSRDNFRSGLALDPDSMYDYCVQYKCTLQQSVHKNMLILIVNEIINFLI